MSFMATACPISVSRFDTQAAYRGLVAAVPLGFGDVGELSVPRKDTTMARFQHWLSHLLQRAQGASGRAPAAAAHIWTVTPPADPTQPLWLVPAYQRQRRSGDRPLQR
jgi:hypothetical protein